MGRGQVANVANTCRYTQNNICSKKDRNAVEKYLSLVFTDTIFTPEPEPYYYLKFSYSHQRGQIG